MPIEPWQPLSPDNGSLFLAFDRRFRYLVTEAASAYRNIWIPTVLACPICCVDTGLRFGFQTGVDGMLQAQCPAGHIWAEPRVPLAHWEAYCRIRAGQPEADAAWLIDAGFGEEPPPPIDYKKEITGAAKSVAKYAKNKAKAKVRSKVRKAKKKAVKQAMRPVAAGIRAAWAWQAGGVEPVKKSGRTTAKKTAAPKTPPLSAYRKAYGMEAPKKGPKCLVCEDSGQITAPGISIPCTECKGPAAAAMAAAEKKAAKAREGKGAGGRSRVENHGVIVGPGEKVTGPVQVTGGSGAAAARSAAKVAASIAKGAAAPGTRRVVNTGVQNIAGGQITGVVQVVGDGHQVNAQTGKNIGRPLTAKESAAVRGAVDAATRAARAAGGSNSTVHISGKNNSVVQNVTSGGQTQTTDE
ncbi:hypothetical protein ACOKM5_44395 [Streptomyces sp. BH097]|uniref:hypothetical protein n=1 Tax=Streptomyces sp. BH097 TaxID=3410406 RepID=UPI003CF6F046